MARVPTVENFRTELPSGRQPSLPEPETEAFTAGAKTVQEGARNAGVVASAATELYAKQLDEANKTRVLAATNEARRTALDLTYDPNEGYAHIKGASVLDRPSGKPLSVEYDGKLTDRINNISAGLGNDAQRRMFADQSAQVRTAFLGDVDAHTSQEYKVYQTDTLSDAIKLNNQQIAANPRNTLLRERLLAENDQHITALSMVTGRQGQVESDKIMARSQSIGASIEQAMNEDDWHTATALFEKYGPGLDANIRNALQGRLEEGRRADQALSVFDSLDGRATTVTGSVVPTMGARPVEGGVKTGDYGEQRPGHLHGGEDWAVPTGSPVFAQLPGQVSMVGHDAKQGNFMHVTYADGSEHVFMHLSEQLLPKGAEVQPGQVFAKSGATGNAKGPHLHWEVKVDGQRVNPTEWANSNGKPGSRPSGQRFTGTTVEQYVNAGIDAARRANPNLSAKDVDAIRREGTARWSLHTSSEREAANDATEEAQRWVANNPHKTVDQMPANLRNNIIANDPAGLAQVYSFASAIRPKAGTARDPIQDDIAYNKAITDAPYLKSLSNPEFNAIYAGHPSFNTISQRRAQLLGLLPTGNEADPGNLNYPTINAVLDARLVPMGINVDDKKDEDAQARAGAIRAAVIKEIAFQQQSQKGVLNDVGITQAIDGFLARKNLAGTPTAAVTYDDMDPGTRDAIEAQLPPGATKQQVLERYQSTTRFTTQIPPGEKSQIVSALKRQFGRDPYTTEVMYAYRKRHGG
jgi:murein DD-endopeptidase MepM/ murein hydrolase activator NlpD